MSGDCFIPDCTTRKGEHSTFFTLPGDSETLLWWSATGWAKLGHVTVPTVLSICERHFLATDIDRSGAVPTLVSTAKPARNVVPMVTNFLLQAQQDPNPLPQCYCRLCGRKVSLPLEKNVKLLELLEGMLSLRLELDRGYLPQGICIDCEETAQLMIYFRRRSVAAQLVFESLFDVLEPGEIRPGMEEYIDESTHELDYDDVIEEEEEEEVVMVDENDKNATDAVEEPTSLPPRRTCNPLTVVISRRMPTGRRLPEESNGTEPTKRDCHPKVHNKKRTYICDTCGKTLHTTATLKNHVKLHANERNFKCSLCDKRYYVKRDLKMHIESVHERKLFPCKLCNLQCRWEKGLQRHMKTHQQDAKKHSCKICDKSFLLPSQLRQHQMVHSGARLTCELCGVGYRFNYMLTQHKIRVHKMKFEGVQLYKPRQQKRRNGGRVQMAFDEQVVEESVEQFTIPELEPAAAILGENFEPMAGKVE